MELTYTNQPGAILAPDSAHSSVTYTDNAGVQHYDFLYNNQNDFNTWTANPAHAGGVNPLTGLAYNRGDNFFSSYTSKADELGKAEAARQAAEDSDDFFKTALTAAAIGTAIYFGGAGLGYWGGATESAGAAALGAETSFVGPATGSVFSAGAQASGAFVAPVVDIGAGIVSTEGAFSGALGALKTVNSGLSAFQSVSKALGGNSALDQPEVFNRASNPTSYKGVNTMNAQTPAAKDMPQTVGAVPAAQMVTMQNDDMIIVVAAVAVIAAVFYWGK